MNVRNAIITCFCIFLSLLIAVGLFVMYRRQSAIEENWQQMQQECAYVCAQGVAGARPQVIEKVISMGQLWRPIQERIRDTVVQIFTQISVIDLMQPYKTPSQATAYGSGFFINEQGDFITNAHVVEQAKAVWIQIPSLGKSIIDAEVISISPQRDLALLRVKSEGLNLIRQELGGIPYLPLGDSDLVRRSDEVLAIGYPLGQQSLKSTTGVISGREKHLIQMSAPINPGSSGGPLLNIKGEVVGINSAGIVEAQNVGYAIQINDLKRILPDMYKIKVLRKPFLGVLFNNGSAALTEFLQNPQPGGCYVVEIVKGSTFDRAGVQRADMIYEINGYRVDVFGEMSVPWSEDKISITDYPSRLMVGEEINLIIYRHGERKEFSVKFSPSERPAIHRIYPGYEDIDYEVFGGMVVMELTVNHIRMLGDHASGLTKYSEIQHQSEPILLITHIFPDSQLFRSRTISLGTTLNEVNGISVKTLTDYRKALRQRATNKFLTLLASDNVTRASDYVFVVLEMEKVLEEEPKLARDYKYPLSETAKEILRVAGVEKALAN